MAGERKNNMVGNLIFLFLLFFVAMTVTTQFFASSMEYKSILGNNFHNLYLPWKIFNWYGENPELFSKALFIGALVLSSEIICWLFYISIPVVRKKNGLFRSDEGFFVGTFEDDRGFTHHFIFHSEDMATKQGISLEALNTIEKGWHKLPITLADLEDLPTYQLTRSNLEDLLTRAGHQCLSPWDLERR